MWHNPASGSSIPASTKRIVRLQQDGKCVTRDHEHCTGTIDHYEHVPDTTTLDLHRSHANDPALIEGVCTPCSKTKARQANRAATQERLYRKPRDTALAETAYGQPHTHRER